MASEAEKLKALKLKEKAKALKEKEKAKTLKEKEKAKALKEKEKAKALKEKEREKAKKAREKAKKAKDSKKGGTDDPSPPFYMFNLVLNTIEQTNKEEVRNKNTYQELFKFFTEDPINMYLTSIKEHYTEYVRLVEKLHTDYISHINNNNNTDPSIIENTMDNIDTQLNKINQTKNLLDGDSILFYLNWVFRFSKVFMITKRDGLPVKDPTLIGNYTKSFADIMQIINNEDSNNEDSNKKNSRSIINKLLTNMDIFQPKTSVGNVAALMKIQ